MNIEHLLTNTPLSLRPSLQIDVWAEHACPTTPQMSRYVNHIVW